MSKTPHIKNIFSAEEEDCLSLEQMLAYRDGNLDAAGKYYAERHLLNCELCGMAYEGVVEEDAATLEAGAVAISEAAWDRIGEREKKRRRGAWIWISAAASIVMVITLGLVFFNGPTDQQMEEIAEQYYKQPDAPIHTRGDIEDSAAIAMGKPETQKSDLPKVIEEEEPLQDANLEAGPEDRWLEQQLQEKEMAELSNAKPAKEETRSMAGGDQLADGKNMEKTLEWTATLKSETKAGAGTTAANGMAKPSNNQAPLAAGKDPKALGSPPVTTIGPKRNADQDKNAGQAPPASGNYFDNADEFSMEDSEVVEAEEMDAVVIIDQQRANDNDVKNITPSSTIEPTRAMNREGKSKGKSPSRDAMRAKKATNSPATKDKTTSLYKDQDSRAEESIPMQADDTGAAVADSVMLDPFAQGMESYREGRFAESATLLRKATGTTPANLNAHFYAAASFMNIDQPQAAIYHLDRILAVPGNSHFADAEWYKALALLKLKDRQNAKTLLQKIANGGGTHAKDAAKALKEL